MESKSLKVFGYWAIGLILFIATIIVVRWAIDFITWSGIDSGWAQVIGSVAALAVAIFVMSRQNAHATRLITEADVLALRRRAAAVKAIADRAEGIVIIATQNIARMNSNRNANDAEDELTLRTAKLALDDIREALKSIPTHELGSYRMAEGINLLAFNIGALSGIVETMANNASARRTQDATDGIIVCLGKISECKAQFDAGAKEFLHDHSPFL